MRFSAAQLSHYKFAGRRWVFTRHMANKSPDAGAACSRGMHRHTDPTIDAHYHSCFANCIRDYYQILLTRIIVYVLLSDEHLTTIAKLDKIAKINTCLRVSSLTTGLTNKSAPASYLFFSIFSSSSSSSYFAIPTNMENNLISSSPKQQFLSAWVHHH